MLTIALIIIVFIIVIFVEMIPLVRAGKKKESWLCGFALVFCLVTLLFTGGNITETTAITPVQHLYEILTRR